MVNFHQLTEGVETGNQWFFLTKLVKNHYDHGDATKFITQKFRPPNLAEKTTRNLPIVKDAHVQSFLAKC